MKTNELDELIIIRDVAGGDINFIYDTWLNGLYFGNETFHLMREHIFKRNYQRVLNYLLSLPRCTIRVCALSEDHDTIIGYSVCRGTSLDWVFVKPIWRRLGVAKRIIPPEIETFTHVTKMVRGFKPKEWEFNPFI